MISSSIVCQVLNEFTSGSEVAISIRPEDVRLHAHKPADGQNIWPGKIQRSVYLGNLIDYQVSVGDREVRIQTDASEEFKESNEIFIELEPKECLVMKK